MKIFGKAQRRLAALGILMALPSAAAAAMPAMTVNKGDTAWMLTSTILVLAMILPGLALFYGGLVRSKNMLTVLSQVLGIPSVAIFFWVGWGYTLAFYAGTPFSRGRTKLLSQGINGAR